MVLCNFFKKLSHLLSSFVLMTCHGAERAAINACTLKMRKFMLKEVLQVQGQGSKQLS